MHKDETVDGGAAEAEKNCSSCEMFQHLLLYGKTEYLHFESVQFSIDGRWQGRICMGMCECVVWAVTEKRPYKWAAWARPPTNY